MIIDKRFAKKVEVQDLHKVLGRLVCGKRLKQIGVAEPSGTLYLIFEGGTVVVIATPGAVMHGQLHGHPDAN